MDKFKEKFKQFLSSVPFLKDKLSNTKNEMTRMISDISEKTSSKLSLLKKWGFGKKKKEDPKKAPEATPTPGEGESKPEEGGKEAPKEVPKNAGETPTETAPEEKAKPLPKLQDPEFRRKILVGFLIAGVGWVGYDEFNKVETPATPEGKTATVKKVKKERPTPQVNSRPEMAPPTEFQGESAAAPTPDMGDPNMDQGGMNLGELETTAPSVPPVDRAPSEVPPQEDLNLDVGSLEAPPEPPPLEGGTEVAAVSPPPPAAVPDAAIKTAEPEMDILKEMGQARENRKEPSMGETTQNPPGDLKDSVAPLKDVIGNMEVSTDKPEPLVPLPDFDRFGRGLVYNCQGKHWACLDKTEFFNCKNHQIWTKQKGETPICVIYEVYLTDDDCNRAQTLKVNERFETGFCKN